MRTNFQSALFGFDSCWVRTGPRQRGPTLVACTWVRSCSEFLCSPTLPSLSNQKRGTWRLMRGDIIQHVRADYEILKQCLRCDIDRFKLPKPRRRKPSLTVLGGHCFKVDLWPACREKEADAAVAWVLLKLQLPDVTTDYCAFLSSVILWKINRRYNFFIGPQ